MAKWFYYNEQGNKIEVTGGQLKGLAKQGLITPETIVETAEGKSAPARKVKGLTFGVALSPELAPKAETSEPEVYGVSPPKPPVEVNPFTVAPPVVAKPVEEKPFAVPMPIVNQVVSSVEPATAQGVLDADAEHSGGSSWKVTVIGAVLILIVGGIAWQFLARNENSRPPADTRVVEVPANEIPPVQGIAPVQAPPRQEGFIEPNPFLNVVPADFSF